MDTKKVLDNYLGKNTRITEKKLVMDLKKSVI